MIDSEIKLVLENVDAWIKQIRREFADFSDIPVVVNENTNTIQHNYELIIELKDEIEELKQEINAMKLIQICVLKVQHNSLKENIAKIQKIKEDVLIKEKNDKIY